MHLHVFGPVQLPFTHDGLHITVNENNHFIMVTKKSFSPGELVPKVVIRLMLLQASVAEGNKISGQRKRLYKC